MSISRFYRAVQSHKGVLIIFLHGKFRALIAHIGGLCMNPTLRDICKDAKIRKGITTQKLSDETGISISTINNFFATASKSPSVYNAGDICAVLGVSLDRYFGIEEDVPAEKRLEEMQQNREAELKAAHLEGNVESMAQTIDLQHKRIKSQQRVIYVTISALVIVMLLLAVYVFLDFKTANMGLIRGGVASVFAWVLIAVLIASSAITLAVLVSMVRKSKG